MQKVKQYVSFDGPCHFLSCLETGPHFHPICPVCGAVRYGNLFCKECREYHHWPEKPSTLKIQKG